MRLNVPETQLPRIVIIGGGFAGITLARSLHKTDAQVVMLDRDNYHTFQPLLYQVATAGLEPDSIAFPLRKLFEGYSNFCFRMAEVLEIETEHNTVRTSIGDIRYDYLVVATGSSTNFFGLNELEHHAHGMKDLKEALDLRSLILQNFEKALLTSDVVEREALMTFVLVGAGPTGVEMAGALGELKKHILPHDYPELDLRRMRIHLVEASSRVLSGMSEAASRSALEFLRDLDVNVWLNTAVESYDGLQARTANGKVLETRALIWSAGVHGAGIEGLPPESVGANRRILVENDNRVQGLDNVFALGDIACMVSPDYPEGHPMVATVAMQQGRHLGRNFRRLLQGESGLPFVYRDKGAMATVGRHRAVADIGKARFKGLSAWILWLIIHLLYLIGFRNKVLVFVNWVWNYVSYDRGNRLIVRPFRRRDYAAREHEPERHIS